MNGLLRRRNCGKLLAVALLTLLAAMAVFAAGTSCARASVYYYFKTPKDKATYTAGKTLEVKMYAGGTRTYTKCDAWGQPESTTYQKMPVTLKVFKGSRQIFEQEYTYTTATTLSVPYDLKTTGTLTLKMYARSGGLYDDTQTLQDTRTIKVKKIKAKAVSKVKPAITVERTAKKKAVITCDANYGYGFKVYRATKKNGKYKLVGTVKAGKTSFTDKKLSASGVYFYKVKIFAKSGKKTYTSKYSAAVKAAKYSASQDSSSLKVKVSNATSGVKISWSKNSKAGYYLVGRFTDLSKEAEETWCGGENDLSWTDTNASKGKTYYYIVSAWYGDDSTPLVKSSPVKIKVE